MINVAVLNLKDLFKYILKFIAIIIVVIVIANSYKFIAQSSHISSLDKTIPAISYFNGSKSEEVRNCRRNCKT